MSKKSSAAALLLYSCVLTAADARRFEAAEPHMGTLFRITIYADDGEQARSAFRAAFDRVKQLDQVLSDYKPDSELMQVCRLAFAKPIAVSPDLFTVLESAQRLAKETDGAFDITLGPVIRLWREARARKRLPAPEEIEKALRSCGYKKLALDTSGKTVRLLVPDMQIDLGAIAKGYAADQALKVLRGIGFERALIAASGDIAMSGAPPGTGGWRVGIDCPDASAGEFSKVLTLRNAAVSTSGDTEQYLESGGIRYSHIIDPRTGMGLTERVCVSVVATAGMEADSLATAVSVLAARNGDQAALKLMDHHPAASARIVRPDRFDTGAPGTSPANQSRP
ncbi:MAG: FAD:protein FMN transferase [Acidobacteriota bacterium]|nr:FAD:protein FMN transferase [Acidobacteriota bacterium]